MKKTVKIVLSLLLVVSLTIGMAGIGIAVSNKESNDSMRVGVGKADITGPVTKISTGYNSLGDLMNGLLMRLHARAFIVEAGDNTPPMVYVSAEIVHMTESIKPAVLKELANRGLTQYTEENVMISATHCHSSTSNTSWYGLYDLINGVPGYDDDSYKLIVKGIADAIEAADKDLAPGSITLSYADTDIDSYNRSLVAMKWNKNYDESAYANDFIAACETVNKEMSILQFKHGDEDIGMLSFFASHGTSNGIDNTYVSADHKGYACYYVEQEMGNDYVAANCQTESGDVSPNRPVESDITAAFRRPNDLDSSLDPIENEVVAGQQEANAMLKIIKGGAGVTTVDLSNQLAYNYTTVDFSNISVDRKYIGDYYMDYDTDVDNAKTSEPCIGAGIIAGDEEGAPVDNAAEGSVRHDFKLNEDGTITRTQYDFSTISLYGLEKIMGPVWPTAMKILKSDGYDEAQKEKVVCLAVGNLMQKNQPLQIFRIGEVAIASVPFEVTTEQAKRIKDTLSETLSELGVQKVILSTLTNSYSQYITTREEYAAQHYEGSTSLFGPWSGPATAQELDKLAQGIVSNTHSDKGPGLRNEAPKLLLQTPASLLKPIADTGNPGTLVTDVNVTPYNNGDTVSATFEGANPRHITILQLKNNVNLVPDDYTFMEVQKKVNGEWKTIKTDSDPYTVFKFDNNQATVSCLLRDFEDGTYRLVYNGVKKVIYNKYEAFTAYSSEFVVGNAPATDPTTDPSTETTEKPNTSPTTDPSTNPTTDDTTNPSVPATQTTPATPSIPSKGFGGIIDSIEDMLGATSFDKFKDAFKDLFGKKSDTTTPSVPATPTTPATPTIPSIPSSDDKKTDVASGIFDKIKDAFGKIFGSKGGDTKLDPSLETTKKPSTNTQTTTKPSTNTSTNKTTTPTANQAGTVNTGKVDEVEEDVQIGGFSSGVTLKDSTPLGDASVVNAGVANDVEQIANTSDESPLITIAIAGTAIAAGFIATSKKRIDE